MKVAICDDEKLFRDELEKLLYRFSFEYNIDVSIDTYSSGEELIWALNHSSKNYDLIFLDILMEGQNGIETAKEIRKIDMKVLIAFLTSTVEFALDGYEVKALSYMVKPITYEKLQKIALEVYETQYDANNVFTFSINHALYSIPFIDINYFEVDKRVIYVNAIKNKHIEDKGFYKKIDDLAKELEQHHFIKSHRSYLVNLKNIMSISAKEIVFVNNQTAPISRSLYKDVKNRFLEYTSSLL